MQFNSPWLHFPRPTWPGLKADLHCETAIIGGGISGIATLYFLLTCTEKKVALVEKNAIASGATGYNAGLAVAHIERPLSEMVSEFGLQPTRQAFNEIDSGWKDLLEIHDKIGLRENVVPILSVTLGIHSVEILIHSLLEEQIELQLGRPRWQFLVVDDERVKSQIPEGLRHSVQYVPHEQILSSLKTTDSEYIAAAIRIRPIEAARMSSAKFCFQVLQYLQQQFPDRFTLYENTEISRIEIFPTQTILKHPYGKIHAQDVILCTNGYKNFTLIDQVLEKPLTKLTQEIIPKEGYLAGYSGDRTEMCAYAFLTREEAYRDVPYWYISHGPLPGSPESYLSIVGGPEYDLSVEIPREIKEQHAENSREEVKKFLANTYGDIPGFNFFWRGLMGYTRSGLRWIGPDPQHPRLWYNLGCNGIGVIPAIAGARKIARLMNGEVLGPSIFDPPI